VDVHKVIDQLYKQHFAKMVIALAKYTGLHDLSTAEDIVQDAFVEATRQWPAVYPDHPKAWLYRVCRNLAYRRLREGKLKRTASVYESEKTIQYQVDHLFNDEDSDDQLRMMYASVHPDFAPKSQVIFALRYVASFRIEQIAMLLGMHTEAVTKSLLRMREAIAQKNIRFPSSSLQRTSNRTPVVLKVLYLMFSEGYSSSQGKSLLNLELCEDALSLTQSIVRSTSLKCPEAEGLLALILFSLSRFESRFNKHNELVDLENQDRSRWNKELIRVAEYHLGRARNASYGTWHLEAAVAFLHSTAPSFAETDWKGIASIYTRILATNDSPFTRLNRAIAIFYSGDIDQAFTIMEQLGHSAIMHRYHLYHVAMGKFHLGRENHPEANKHFELATTLTRHAVEKEFIIRLISR
jgi:RNA polymerase sigma factor (sigma-70 family)